MYKYAETFRTVQEGMLVRRNWKFESVSDEFLSYFNLDDCIAFFPWVQTNNNFCEKSFLTHFWGLQTFLKTSCWDRKKTKIIIYFSANLGDTKFFKEIATVCPSSVVNFELKAKETGRRQQKFLFLGSPVFSKNEEKWSFFLLQQCTPTIAKAECRCFCQLICYHYFSVLELGQKDQPVQSFTPGCHCIALKGVLSGILWPNDKAENMISQLIAETFYHPYMQIDSYSKSSTEQVVMGYMLKIIPCRAL